MRFDVVGHHNKPNDRRIKPIICTVMQYQKY